VPAPTVPAPTVPAPTVPASFVLASSSPARLRLLRAAGFDPQVVVSGVDERVDGAPGTAISVAILAERKAAEVAARRPDALVLGCDSLLDVDGAPTGKPACADAAAALWARLAGRSATLFTGHCLIEPGGRRARGVTATVVRFAVPSAAELAAYLASGEPLTVAGAFTLDGYGAPFVASIDGDSGTVIGLCLPLLRRLLADLGVPVTSLWRS
jgi:septum formation protein